MTLFLVDSLKEISASIKLSLSIIFSSDWTEFTWYEKAAWFTLADRPSKQRPMDCLPSIYDWNILTLSFKPDTILCFWTGISFTSPVF